VTLGDTLRQASGGALPLGQATAALSGKCWQSLELRARRGVESSLPADAPKAPWLEENLPPGWRPQPENLGPLWLAGSWNAPMHFSRIAPATQELEIWSASERGFSFVISNESSSGPGLHGKPGFVASWRPINFNRTAIRVAGSPFKTFAEAENACEAMLAHLTKSDPA
jgi:hypothetical protein